MLMNPSQPAQTPVRLERSSDRLARFLHKSGLIVFLLVSTTWPLSAARHSRKPTEPQIHQGKPAVQQVDPPNWWSGLPNPMLLLRGKNLLDANITSSVAGISVRRARISDNGHWAFVWLDISSAPPQAFSLVVRTQQGKVRVPFELAKRHAPTDGFQGFSPSDVMYLLLPDRFAEGDVSNQKNAAFRGTVSRNNPNAYHGGNLAGIAQHLDYIHSLGATTLWIAPIYAQDPASASDYSGYAPVDLYHVNPHFGGLQDYSHLADQVHAQGMKLVLDMVLNHVGPASPWVADPPAPDWFHGTPSSHIPASADFAPVTDPHAPPAAAAPVVDGWLFNTMPDLNQSNPLVRQYLIQNAIWWIESGALDGLRLDTFPYVDRDFWQSFHAELHALYPHLTTVGEIDSSDPAVVAYFAGGVKHAGIDTGLYTAFDFPGYFAIRAALAGGSQVGYSPMSSVPDVQRRDWFYPHPERLVTFFGNQDTPRILSTPGGTASTLKLAFGLIATMRGIPQIYCGDEIALTGTTATDNRSDFPGGFPGDTNNAFTAEGRSAAQQEMFSWVTSLLQLRAQHDVLQTGMQQTLLADQTGLVYARYPAPPQRARPAAGAQAGETLLILMNKADAPRAFHLDFSRTALDGTTTLTPLLNSQQTVTASGNAADFTVQPAQIVVLAAQR
jgi:glycosidase